MYLNDGRYAISDTTQIMQVPSLIVIPVDKQSTGDQHTSSCSRLQYGSPAETAQSVAVNFMASCRCRNCLAALARLVDCRFFFPIPASTICQMLLIA